MKSLLIYKCQLSSNAVDILLGSLRNWVVNHHTIEIPKEVEQSASQLCVEKGKIHYLIALRLCMIWYVYKKHTDAIPTKFTFPYYMGIVMDLHIPSFHLGPSATLQEIYSKNMAPENITIDQVEHDEFSRIDALILERHWVSYMCHIPTSSHSFGEEREISLAKKRKTVKGLQNSLVIAQEHKSKSTCRQDLKSLNELLTKGQPNQTVVRYVQKAFVKGLIKSPQTNPIVITMTRMFFLGSFRHSTVVAPPKFRIEIYKKHTPQTMYSLLETLQYNAKQLYFILAEFIVANTMHNHALHSMLIKNEDHKKYEMNAQYHGDEMRSRQHPKFKHIAKPMKMAPITRTPSKIRLFWELTKHLDVKNKPQPKRVTSATSKIGLRRLFEVLERQPNTLQIHKDILVALEMDAKDIDRISDLMEQSNERISKGMKKMLTQIGRVSRDLLYMYVFYITRRMMLAYIPVDQHKWPRFTGDAVMAVCRNCFMIRTPCLMERPYKKARSKGVQIDVENGMLRCSGCKSDKIDQIDMRRAYVHGPAMSDPTKSRTYCTCYRCGIMTVYRHVIGTAELCQSCYSNDVAQLLVVRKCICGRSIEDKAPHKTITALNSEGKVSLYGLCKEHFFVKNASRESDIQPIAFYRKFISNTSRKRKREG